MHHTIITIDLASIGNLDPATVARFVDQFMYLFEDDETLSETGIVDSLDEWKVRVHQEHNGVVSAVPGWTTPEGERA
jgi:hypothetical protein